MSEEDEFDIVSLRRAFLDGVKGAELRQQEEAYQQQARLAQEQQVKRETRDARRAARGLPPKKELTFPKLSRDTDRCTKVAVRNNLRSSEVQLPGFDPIPGGVTVVLQIPATFDEFVQLPVIQQLSDKRIIFVWPVD